MLNSYPKHVGTPGMSRILVKQSYFGPQNIVMVKECTHDMAVNADLRNFTSQIDERPFKSYYCYAKGHDANAIHRQDLRSASSMYLYFHAAFTFLSVGILTD